MSNASLQEVTQSPTGTPCSSLQEITESREESPRRSSLQEIIESDGGSPLRALPDVREASNDSQDDFEAVNVSRGRGRGHVFDCTTKKECNL